MRDLPTSNVSSAKYGTETITSIGGLESFT